MATATVEFSIAEAPADHLILPAPIISRVGSYDFPAEQGGPFEITVEDIRRAVSSLPADGLPITDEHNKRSVFYGKLGKILELTPSADYTTFGGKVALAKPVRDLLGPGPIKLSANWDRTTKTLKDISLTGNPRITDAALEAAFAAYDPANAALPGAAYPQPVVMPDTQGGGASMKGASTLTVTGDPDALASLQAICAKMGLSCSLGGAPAGPATEVPMSKTATPPAVPQKSAREEELERRLVAVEQANREAQFSVTVARGEAEISSFMASPEVRARILPAGRPGIEAMLRELAVDDAREPREVHFANTSGQMVSGNRLQKAKAAILALPPHGVDGELLRVREAEFSQAAHQQTTPGNTTVPTQTKKSREELLSLSHLGRSLIRERSAAK